MAKLDFAPAIDDDGIVAAEVLSGAPIRVEPYNHEATRDTIRHYAWGIGDDNPLWCDPAYARSTPFGRLLAPPTFLYSSFDGAVGAALPGVQPIYAGTSWEFHGRIGERDEIVPESRFGAVRRLTGTTARAMLIQEAETYYRVDDRVVATAVAGTFRVPRRDAENGLQYEARDEYSYSDEELARIRREALGEYRRGAEPLVFSDVRVGNEVPPVVKGPIDRITMTAYYMGCQGSPGYKGCEMAWKYRDWALRDPQQLPSNYDPSYYAENVLPSVGHQDSDVAQEIGMPNAYDNGPQRCGWFSHVVTNWMGDLAFLRRLEVRLRRPNIFGDTLWVGGRVSALREEGGFGAIDLELWGDNQLGERTATATATVLTHLEPRPEPVEL